MEKLADPGSWSGDGTSLDLWSREQGKQGARPWRSWRQRLPWPAIQNGGGECLGQGLGDCGREGARPRRGGELGGMGAWRKELTAGKAGSHGAPARWLLLPWSREEEGCWRLKEMEGWECKIAKCKGRGLLFIEEALGLGFP